MTVRTAGKAGLPADGTVGAVIVSVSVLDSSGPLELRAWAPGTPRPPAPLITTPGGPASSWAVVPVTTNGRFLIDATGSSADVAVDVFGWVSNATESGAAGLLRQVAPTQALDVSLNPAESTLVDVAGSYGVPSTGAVAVLVRVDAAGASAGRVQVAGALAHADSITTVAHAANVAAQAWSLVALDSGRLRVGATSTDATHVAMTVLGFVTGASPDETSGGVAALDGPGVLLDAPANGGDQTVQVAGVGGVPTATSTTPPTAALVRVSGTGLPAGSSLQVRPGGADATAAVENGNLTLEAGSDGTAAGAALVALGPGGDLSVATPATGHVRLTADGWLAGEVVLQPAFAPLSSANLAALAEVTPTSIRFHGVPADLSGIGAGAVVNAPIGSVATQGFLRKVTAVGNLGGDLVWDTTAASLDEAVASGHVDSHTSPPAASAALAPTARRSRPSVGGTVGGDVGIGPLHVDVHDGSLDLNAQASASLSASLSVDIGFFHFDAAAHARAAASATVGVAASVDESLDQQDSGSIEFAPIPIVIGPVVIELVPKATATLHVTGSLKASFNASASASASVGIDWDDDTGFALDTDPSVDGGHASGIDGGATITAALSGRLALLAYGSAGFFAELTPSATATVDPCTVHGEAQIDLSAGVEVDLFELGSHSASVGTTLASTTLFNERWRKCAYFTGTLTLKDHNEGNDGTYIFSQDTKVAVSFAQTMPDDPNEFVRVTTSGNYSEDAIDPSSFGCSATEPLTVRTVWPSHRKRSDTLVQTTEDSHVTGTYYVDYTGPQFKTPGTETDTHQGPYNPSTNQCDPPTTQTTGILTNLQLATAANGFAEPSFVFTNDGDTSTITEHANESIPGYTRKATLKYVITFHCLYGASSC